MEGRTRPSAKRDSVWLAAWTLRGVGVETVAAVVSYVAVYVGWRMRVGPMVIWYGLWQLLPAEDLRRDFLGSLWDLHGQPPLLNALFGAALRLGAIVCARPEAVLEAIQFALGLTVVVVLARHLQALVPQRGLRVGVLVYVLSNPFFYAMFWFLFFYTAYELFFLVLIAHATYRWLATRSFAALAIAVAATVGLVHTRSVFHPLWALGVLGLLLSRLRGVGFAQARPAIAVAALALVCLIAWPAKNWLRFGFAGYSSWSGYNLARALPIQEPLLTRYFERTLPIAIPSADRARIEDVVPERFRDRPTLTSLTKSDGSPNWNHWFVLQASNELGQRARSLLLSEPRWLWRKARLFFGQGVSQYEGRNVYTGAFNPPLQLVSGWARGYEAVTFCRFAPPDPLHPERVTTVFGYVLPLVLLGPLLVLWRKRSQWSAETGVMTLMMATVLWVLAMTLFVDGTEANRIRYPTSPYLAISVAWAIGQLWRGPRASQPAPAQGQAPTSPRIAATEEPANERSDESW